MKKMLRIATMLIGFSLLVSSFAFASFDVNQVLISESAFMLFQGIGLMLIGSCLRGAGKQATLVFERKTG